MKKQKIISNVKAEPSPLYFWKLKIGKERKIIITSLFAMFLFIGISVFQKPESLENKEELIKVQREVRTRQNIDNSLAVIQKNTLISMSNPLIIQRPKAKLIQELEPKVKHRIKMTITAYSSTPCQTDSTPFITASNSWVRKGIVANNFFPFGTRIRIPEYFGDKIFDIEDRLHWRKSNEHVDVWFPTRQEAINFGITSTYVEILAD